ncbi:MAG: hypothetical protein K1V96_09165 [Lachnospiraceae bacterium]
MTKKDLLDWLFEMLNEHDSLFLDVGLDDTLDALLVTTIDKERFIIMTDYLKENEEMIRCWEKNNPVTFVIEMALMILADLGIISERQREDFHLQVTKFTDVLQETYKHKGLEELLHL